MRSPRRARTLLPVLLASLALAASMAAPALAQTVDGNDSGLEDRLVSFASRLRFCVSIASISVYAPTLADQRLHAQQIVNLLEGSEGRHYIRPAAADDAFPGLMSEVAELNRRLSNDTIEADARIRAAAATKNVATYLEFARDAALLSLDRRHLGDATEELLRVYAYLAAAYERPGEATYVPGLWTVLRLFGLAEGPSERLEKAP